MDNANSASHGAPPTPTVFISGSLSVRHLTDLVEQRLRVIADRKLPILIGDAPGVDAVVQRFLSVCGARDVTVFCGGLKPRHNIGEWPIAHVQANAAAGTRAWHSAKDREMSRLAGTGFVIWDGTSQGSYANIRRLCERGRPVVIWLQNDQRFLTLRSDADRTAFLTTFRGRP